MKRTGFLRRTTRLRPVSAKVTAGKPEYDAVIAAVKARSGGRCEVTTPFNIFARANPTPVFLTQGDERCPAKAADPHHTRKPRRSFHDAKWVIHICRRHHAMTTASFRVGRLLTEPRGDGTFTCTVVQKASKFA